MSSLLGDVFVINLDSSPQRMRAMMASLEAVGVASHRRMPAVDGQRLSQRQVRENSTLACRSLLCSRSMIGCALSHAAVWRTIASEDRPVWHVVMEDDTSFLPQTMAALRQLEPQVAGLETEAVVINLVPGAVTGGPSVETLSLVASPLRLLPRPMFMTSTACYLLTTAAARLLLACTRSKAHYHVDVVMYHCCPGLRVLRVDRDLFGNNGAAPELSTNMSRLPVLPLLDGVLPPRQRFMLRSTVLCLGTYVQLNTMHVLLGMLLVTCVLVRGVPGCLLCGYLAAEATALAVQRLFLMTGQMDQTTSSSSSSSMLESERTSTSGTFRNCTPFSTRAHHASNCLPRWACHASISPSQLCNLPPRLPVGPSSADPGAAGPTSPDI